MDGALVIEHCRNVLKFFIKSSYSILWIKNYFSIQECLKIFDLIGWKFWGISYKLATVKEEDAWTSAGAFTGSFIACTSITTKL
jgi:hypothetical protein